MARNLLRFQWLCFVMIMMIFRTLNQNIKVRSGTAVSNNNILCPGDVCFKGNLESKCVSSSCECKENNECKCLVTDYYKNHYKSSLLLNMLCRRIKDDEHCEASYSCRTGCCLETKNTCGVGLSTVHNNQCKVDFPVKKDSGRRRRERRRLELTGLTLAKRVRTNYTVPNTFSLIPNITISFPSSNKCWADGTCAGNENPNKADVFGTLSKSNMMMKPIQIPGVSGPQGIRPFSPEYLGRFDDPNNLNYECGDGTQECDYACCSYGFCIDPTNDCTPYTSKASFYSLYTFIALAVFCIVYWVLFWYFGVEYAKQVALVHPSMSQNNIPVENPNMFQPDIPHHQVESKDPNSSSKDVTINDQKSPSKDVSIEHGGIYPDEEDINEKKGNF